MGADLKIQIEFSLSSMLPANAQLRLNIVGIFEREQAKVQASGGLPPQGTYPPNRFFLSSFAAYQRPATDPSLRFAKYP